MWVILTFLTFLKTCSLTSEFKSYPTTVKAPENDTVLLPCYLQTTGDDDNIPVKVRWYKDDQLLIDSGNSSISPPERFTLWTNGSLQVINIIPDDTAEYTCEIVRPSPWATIKQVHAIEVLHPPSVIPDPLNGILRVKLGEEVRISCKPEGVPYPIINWYSKGRELKLIDHREMLKFTATDRHLSGTYTCVARNGVGKPASANIDLTITYPPELMTSRSWIHTAPGLKIEISCEVSADPPATVTWLKRNIPLLFDKRIFSIEEENKHILIIRNVTSDDFGEYTCRAHNSMGQGDLRIQLAGQANPPIFKIVDQKNINTKHSYRLIWTVDSYTPIIEYKLAFKPQDAENGWKKLYIPAEPSTGSTHSTSYIIEGLKANTVYVAYVVARNHFGWSKPSLPLRFATDGAELQEDTKEMEIIIDNELIPETLPRSRSTRHYSFICSFIYIPIYINMLTQ